MSRKNRIGADDLTTRMRRGIALASAWVLVLGVPGVAWSAPEAVPAVETLDRVFEAAATAREHAVALGVVSAASNAETGLPDHAEGDPGHATGLERAREVVAAAADRGNGNGNAFGRGRAAQVHAQLLAGGSPSDLPNHGAEVRELVRAYQALKGEGGDADPDGD